MTTARIMAGGLTLLLAACGCRMPDGLPGGRSALRQDLVLRLGRNLTMRLVLIPSGRFRMGTLHDERGNEGPQHEVTISRAFYMGVHHVTRRQFAAFVQDSGYVTDAEREGWVLAWNGTAWGPVKGLSWRNPGFAQTDDHPAVAVSYHDATVFCDWLSGKTGRWIRLPTEAEWEYACRASTDTAYQWGDNPDDGKGWCNAADQAACR